MKEITTIQGAVSIVHGTFSGQYARMDFLFTHRHGSHRTVLTVLRSLPGMLLQVSDENGPDVAFESTWVPDQQERKKRGSEIPQGGWQEVASTSWRVAHSYFAHTFMNLRKVREVAVFDYGFEIMTAERVELIALKSLVWQDPSVGYLQSIVGREFKGIKFADNVDNELKMAWRHPIVIERARQIAEKNGEFVSVGQNSRSLLFDVDEV